MRDTQWSFGVVPRLGTMMVLLIDLEALEMAKRCESQLSIEIAEDNVEESARLLLGRVATYTEIDQGDYRE